MSRVVVAGGGLAGLTAARRLATEGIDVRLYEREDDVGGRVRTRTREGFTLDRGFQVLFTAYPAVRRELDLGALDLRTFTPGAVLARPGRRSVLSDPFRDPGGALATLRNDEVTLADKLRVARLQVALRRRRPGELFPGPDQSIAAYLAARGFSRRFVDRFAAPFYGGITLDRSLSTAAAVFEYTFKMLSEGSIAVPADGMGEIPRQLADAARRAGAVVETDHEVTDLAVENETGEETVRLTVDGETERADAAVVAADPPTARDLTGVDAIPTAGRGCVTQYCSLPASVDLETGGRLLLNAHDAEPNQVAPMSTVAPEYAPGDRQLVSATYLGRPDADDGTLLDRTRETLESWYPGESFAGLELVDTDRIPFAQFDQPPGVHGGLPETGAPEGPVFLAGDYTQWSSIQGALDSGREAAEAVRERLG